MTATTEAVVTVPATTTPTVPTLPHMLLLPPNLAALAKCAAKESTRYAMTSVSLSARVAGYRAEATNGRILARVDGTHEQAPEDYPTFAALTSAPNSGTAALVPLDAWSEAFKLAPKVKGMRPVLGNVATVIGQDVVTFGATNLERAKSIETRQQDGRFPDTDSVFPKSAPTVSIHLNADLLVELLRVASEYSPDGDGRITIDVRDATKPLVIRTANKSQAFTGLIMPLT